MEINLSGEWQLFLDRNDSGEQNKWFKPERFPSLYQIYEAPVMDGLSPFQNSKYAWLKKDFIFNRSDKDKFIYLVLFGTDKGKVFLNGNLIGPMKRSAGKQVFEIETFIKRENSIILKFEDIQSKTTGLWRIPYVISGSSVPGIAKKTITHTPKWVNQAVIYSINVRNFSPKGDFQGVVQLLPYLKSLGVNTLWLLPVNTIGRINRKGVLGSLYAIKDYYEINPEFGTREDFINLIKTAHKTGIKIILDLVINHTAPDNVMKSLDLKFYKPKEAQLAAIFGWTDVEDLDYSYRPTRDFIIKVMEYWIREFDIDGYRCDVAYLVPMDFWTEAITHIRKIKNEVLMLAEGDSSAFYTAGFDLIYDWYLKGVLERIDKKYYSYTEINDYLNSQQQYYPQNTQRLIFLENHDTERSVRTFSKENIQTYQVLKYMLPGVPLIYNGEEMSLEDRCDPSEKLLIDWTNPNYSNYNLHKELINLKRKNPAMNEHTSDKCSFKNGPAYFELIRTCQNKNVKAIFEFERSSVTILKNGKKYMSIQRKV